jgi:diguanylate cyclase (GGDEF)-like protein
MAHSDEPARDPASLSPTDTQYPAPEPSSQRPSKILIVDDDPSLREAVVHLLRHSGYEVCEAIDGQMALTKVQGEHFDVVVADIVMPHMDGLAFLKAARQLDSRTAYIIMTGFASWDSAVEAMKLGAADYLPKPFNLELLQLIVARTLEKQRLAERAREAEFYKRLAQTDGLTGLYNHRFFHQLLAVEISRASRFQRPLSLIMLDLDLFKAYNDVNGHQAGDRALRQLAWLLKHSSRSYDLIARYGGDEFAIILPETNKKTAGEVAERIRVSIAKAPIEHAEVLPGGCCTVSLGIASFPDDALEERDLVREADRALYQAKLGGRNRIYLHPDGRA